MGRFAFQKLPKEERIKLIAEFYDAVSCLKNREEARLFFKDLLSPEEIAMLVRRIQVALLLRAGFTYKDIEKALGVGVDKISSVQRSIQRDGTGYEIVLKRLRKTLYAREKKEERKRKEHAGSFPDFAYLKKKYPLYFLISNLFDEFDEWMDDDGKLQLEKEIEEKRKKKS
jgi:TrpR-related protein YerC/YecD